MAGNSGRTGGAGEGMIPKYPEHPEHPENPEKNVNSLEKERAYEFAYSFGRQCGGNCGESDSRPASCVDGQSVRRAASKGGLERFGVV